MRGIYLESDGARERASEGAIDIGTYPERERNGQCVQPGALHPRMQRELYPAIVSTGYHASSAIRRPTIPVPRETKAKAGAGVKGSSPSDIRTITPTHTPALAAELSIA
jgi:hypothetical protein